MRINSFTALGWRPAVVLALLLALNLIARDKGPNIVVQGKVFLIDKGSSIMMVDTTSGRHVVAYTPDTKFSYGRGNKSKESSIDQVQENQYISCTGTLDDSARLLAKECAHREKK